MRIPQLNYQINSASNNDGTFFCGKLITGKKKLPFKIKYKSPYEEAKLGLISPADLPKREILEYAKYNLPCPCCGFLMMHPKLFDKISSVITDVPQDSINLLQHFQNYMHPVERQIFNMIVGVNKKHPNMDFYDILNKKLPTAEKALVLKQTSILSEISLIARDNLPEGEFNNFLKIIDQAYKKILIKSNDKKTSFGQKKFILELEEFFKKISMSDSAIQEDALANVKQKMLNCAYNLPTSYNSIEAFIVKYSKSKYNHKSIAMRLLSGSEATIEHIRPENCGGKTEYSNLILECAMDNHKRHHDDLSQQVSENPQMLSSIQKHFNKLINLSRQRKVDKSYISEIAMTYYKLSSGLIDVDVSGLWKKKSFNNSKKAIHFIKDSKDVFTKAEKREEIKLNRWKKST